MNKINVVYCFDKNIIPLVPVSMYSAFKNSANKIHFYCVTDVTDDSQLEPITMLKKLGMEITLIKGVGSEFDSWKVTHHISPAAYIRFLMPDLINEDKAIYIDYDTIVQEDIGNLYNVDLGDAILGGVAESTGPGESGIAHTLRDTYYNSGVLLMDLKKMRDINLLKLCKDFHDHYFQEILWHDQDIINKVLEGHKKDLDLRWNTQLLRGAKGGHNGILHYNGPVKPWNRQFQSAESYVWWQYYNDMLAELNHE